jgi:uncharacterized protein
MKTNLLKWIYLYLMASTILLFPQQTNTNQTWIEALKIKAAKGNAEAQVDLAGAYYDGEIVAEDKTEAVKWYLKAAEQGNAFAQKTLGDCYKNGDGVSINFVEAVKWYRKVAGSVDTNTPTPQEASYWDHEDSYWCIRAESQKAISECYSNGTGVTQDQQEAARWAQETKFSWHEGDLANLNAMTIRAEQGDVLFQFDLADKYQHDPEIQNLGEAAKWYSRAAMQGDRMSQQELGKMYLSGEGVPQNYIEAYKWFSLAAAQGYPFAATDRDNVSQEMTPEQIAEAQQLSSEFVPRKEMPSSSTSTLPDSPIGSGTGFFVTDNGYLISNYHVVKDAAQVRVVASSGTVLAKVVQVDTANDIALLKVEGNFSALPIAVSRTVGLGDTVATIGFPDPGLQGFSPKLAKGEIAALSGAQDDPRYFQISVPVQPGNSGGALVDEHGNIVGIISAKLDESAALAASGALPENVNYAVKSSFLLSFLESVPDVDSRLKPPNTKDEKFEDVTNHTRGRVCSPF